MKTWTTWRAVATGCAVAGGTAWLAKQGAIAASVGPDGAPPENPVIGVLYLLGVASMLVGATGVGLSLLRGRPALLRAGAAVVGAPLVFFGVQAGADALVDGLVGDGAHWWWSDEGGIVLTALVFLVGGATAWRRSRVSPGTAEPVTSVHG
jgi:hypothetical protein